MNDRVAEMKHMKFDLGLSNQKIAKSISYLKRTSQATDWEYGEKL